MTPFGIEGGIQDTNTEDGVSPVTRTLPGASSGAILRKKLGVK